MIQKRQKHFTHDRLREEAEKLGWKYYLYKLTGGYTTSPKKVLYDYIIKMMTKVLKYQVEIRLL